MPVFFFLAVKFLQLMGNYSQLIFVSYINGIIVTQGVCNYETSWSVGEIDHLEIFPPYFSLASSRLAFRL